MAPCDPLDVLDELLLDLASMLPGHDAAYPATPAALLEWIEVELIKTALSRAKGNESAAARWLGVSRYTLRYRREKFRRKLVDGWKR